MATSNTYGTFASQQIEEIIRQAYQLIGKPGSTLSAMELQSAKTSINGLFAEWVNKGLNLWTVDICMFSIIPGQRYYKLPVGSIATLEVTANQTTRQLNGIAFSSAGGNADNAFGTNPLAVCTQTAPDGYISYDYGIDPDNWQSITYIGIQPNISADYDIVIEYSYDNSEWFEVFYPANTLQTYTKGQVTWFVPPFVPLARLWRIRETNGLILDIQKIYFNTPNVTRVLSPVSRSDFMNIPNKAQQNIVSSYWLNKQIVPIIVLWQNPNEYYDSLIYTRKSYVQDVTGFVQSGDFPQQFYGALVAGLAADLALKFAPDKYEALANAAEVKYNQAARDNVEKVPVRIQPNMFGNNYGIS